MTWMVQKTQKRVVCAVAVQVSELKRICHLSLRPRRLLHGYAGTNLDAVYLLFAIRSATLGEQ